MGIAAYRRLHRQKQNGASMNFTMTLTCKTCDQDIDCRVGMSNRSIQPLSFACPHCSALIYLTLTAGKGFVYEGVKQDNQKQYGLFDGRNPFVDLHLDFPVRFGQYTPGLTPFIVAMNMISGDDEQGVEKIALYQFHNTRLNQLNHFHEKAQEIRTILRLYSGKNKQLFKKRVGQFLNVELGVSLKPEDVNAALYLFVSHVFLPFVHHPSVKSLVEDFTALTINLAERHEQAFNTFVDYLMDTNFLHTVQKDCLDLYPEIYDAELALRPALFLDFVKDYERNKVAARVSNRDFKAYKDLYKDIAEVFGRQLVLVAAINNIIHRDGYNNFAKPEHGNALSSIDKFADKTLSDKFKYLDNCWYKLDSTVVDTSVRNSIAHFTAEYDEISQIITFYPEKEGVRQEKGETMFFMDFMRMILMLFREVHYIHHVIKSLFYYEYLIRSKRRV